MRSSREASYTFGDNYESKRFGLNAFKALGGSYCIGKYMQDHETGAKQLTFVTATDGNHGRGIAWTARKLGQRCVVYMPKGSAEERLENIKKLGAEAYITDMNYDDAVRHAKKMADEKGWIMVQDTAWEGYEQIPSYIMQGYMTMASEAVSQLKEETPTHVFLQAGVGAMSGAVTAFLRNFYGGICRPEIIIVEPDTRSTFDWGIPVPIDEKHVIYVWLDALTNYITALGYPDEPELYEKYWPANVHLVGKEIVRFHSIIWPAMLMSAGLPLPKQVLGHGWLLLGGEKVSKSKAAKAADVVDPVILIDRYGIDALKYFLLREYTFGQDGVFTNEVMLKRMNYDLANDLGNLVSRTVSMIEKYCGGYVPEANTSDSTDEDLKAVAIGAASKVEEQMDKFSFNMALEEIWILVRRANKYIDEKMPWVLAKEPERKAELDTVMHNLAEAIRIISILIEPFMHTTSKEIRKQMGLWYSEAVWEDSFVFDMMNGEQVKKGNAIFPRLDIEKELSELAKLSTAGEAENIPLKLKPEITYDDFDKIDFRVGTIVKAEKHPKADKLLVFQIKMGTEMRQVISGVAEDFTPQEMEGQKVIVVANLKPRQLRGMESAGMLLFAENGKRCEIVTTKAPDGESVN